MTVAHVLFMIYSALHQSLIYSKGKAISKDIVVSILLILFGETRPILNKR